MYKYATNPMVKLKQELLKVESPFQMTTKSINQTWIN